MDSSKNTAGVRHLSLCSGYDGIGLGLELAGIRIGFTVHVEIEGFAAANLVNKIEAGALGAGVHYPNLKTFPFGKFRGCFDILSGGFPCQPFSQAGGKQGDEDPRHLFPYILEGIVQSQPPVVFLENVEGIVSAKLKGDHWRDPVGTPVLLHVIRELERLGYQATAVPASASEVGAPHQRNRWFIIGVADSLRGRGEVSDSGEESSVEVPVSNGGTGRTLWPARPGQEQFGGEPPRVVGKYQEGHNLQKTGYESYRVVGNSDSQQRGTHAEGRISQAEAGSASEGELADSSQCGCDGRGGGAGRGSRCQEDIGEADRSGGSAEDDLRQTQPPLGGDSDGPEGGMDYAELCESCDNRTDELRLLGNGVVPQSAAEAFIRGMFELGYTQCNGLPTAQE